MDTVIGVKFDGGVVVASDQINARSILMYQKNLDKVANLTSHSVMGVAGPNCDMVNFTEFISKNFKLYEHSNDSTPLSLHAQANFTRMELAKALRKGPYQVNVLLGGCDPKTNKSSLYWLDYMGALQEVNYGLQGHASNFCLSIMDREWKQGMSEQEALDIIEKCIKELQIRFLLNQTNFIVKVVDKEGIRIVKEDGDSKDN